jgi:hypothetical protein
VLDFAQIEELEKRRCAALIAGDVDTLNGLLDETLIWVHGQGKLDSKPSFLAGFGGAGPTYLEIKRTEVVVRCFGDAAVVNGVQTMRCLLQGAERHLVNRYVNVWSAHEGEPKMVVWQTTTLSMA